jgi:hypothetical protein
MHFAAEENESARIPDGNRQSIAFFWWRSFLEAEFRGEPNQASAVRRSRNFAAILSPLGSLEITVCPTTGCSVPSSPANCLSSQPQASTLTETPRPNLST